jgi:chromosome segregation ATPase
MLDALKDLTGGGKAKKQHEELQALVAAAREERAALGTMLTQFTTRSTKLAETSKALEQLESKASAAGRVLVDLATTIDALERRTTALGEVEKRVQALLDAASEAQKQTGKVEQLSSQAADALASFEALKRERATLEEFRGELRSTHGELKEVRQSVDQAMALRGELETMRGLAGELSKEHTKFRRSSREARDDATAATEAVREVERKLGRLTHLQELSKATEEKITGLNALAEYVGQKTRALDAQKHAVDRAVVEANRLNEMVWNMDAQIGKLNDDVKQAARAEETLARVDETLRDAATRLDSATRLRDEFVRDTTRMEKEGVALLESMHSSLERLTVGRQEIEAFGARQQALHTAVADAERRMEALNAQERQLAFLPPRLDEFSRQFAVLSGQADELGRRQATLDALQDRLGLVEEMAIRTGAQYDALKQSRADLEALRKEIHEFHQAYAQASQLRDKLSADRAALEAFGESLTAFRARTPHLEASLETIEQRLSQVDEGMRHAARLSEMASDLDRQLARVAERMEFVARVEGRLNALHALAADVDGKLAAQLGRRAELEALREQCDGVIAQMLDAQQKVEAVAQLQGKILPMDIRLSVLQERIEKAGDRLTGMQRSDEELTAQEARLAELVDASRSLAADVAEQLRQTQAFGETVGRADTAREEIVTELARIHARQREVVAQVEAAEDQLRRGEALYKALDQRRSQLAFSEKKLADVEVRLAGLAQVSAEIEQRTKAMADQEAVLQAIRAEVEAVRQISAKSRTDLRYMAGHRDEVAAVRRQMDALLAVAGATEEKIAAIDARRREVEEVQTRTTLITNLLEDVRVNLETVSEQKAVVDYVTERLASVQFVMQEAQNTLRLLSRERELAERIEQSIRQLRTRTGTDTDKGRQTQTA